ncbi:unnamed protein product [Adineta ricciae]|uniref:acylglycerol lipase n=1 Tax=Adineta ricciae TaxID=249248 RepID=A0A816AFK9_ADIRI|nr:unnamed protein product [Adineta ricciae]
MPGHGETVGFSLEDLKADRVIDKLKLFFDALGLTRPTCLIGTSMGGSIVAMFAAKYPSYVQMICLLAPVPPGGYCETDAIRQIRSGMYDIILPRTHEQFYTTADTFAMKKIHCRHLLASQYLKTKLSAIDQHKKILQSAFENDYPNLEKSYAPLKDLTCPALIIWGDKDQLCAVEGAHYFVDLIPNTELVMLKNCGHLILFDKPKETAKSILKFCNDYHPSHQTNRLVQVTF